MVVWAVAADISIHALREESDVDFRYVLDGEDISIHALREESDRLIHTVSQTHVVISIHALREESDFAAPYLVGYLPYFNPRSP